MYHIPFTTIDWEKLERSAHPGETGISWWQTVQLPGLRMRIVIYSAGYLADHWCRKGHIVHCLEGGFTTDLEDGNQVQLTRGMSYIVSDDLSAHRSFSETGVRLLIIDGDFLKGNIPATIG